MLLFFDGAALSLPADLVETVLEDSPHLAQPLYEQGILLNLPPEEHISPQTSRRLTRGLTDVAKSARWPPRWAPSPSAGRRRQLEPHEIEQMVARRTMRHIAPSPLVSHEESDAFLDVMRRRGLVMPSDRAYPSHVHRMHPWFCQIALLAYCQALHAGLQQRTDIALHPLQSQLPGLGLQDFWAQAVWASANSPEIQRHWWQAVRTKHLIEADWATLSLDLSSVPLDEVLGFRKQHGTQFRSYARELRVLLTSWRGQSERQVSADLQAREALMRHERDELERLCRRSLGRTTSTVGIGLAGAAWTALHGDPIGALFAAFSAAAGMVINPATPVTAYSYLFDIQRRWT